LLSSCVYPYPPNPRAPLAAQSPDPADLDGTISSEEQQRIREAREEARRDAETRYNREIAADPRDPGSGPPPKRDYRTAVTIPGKEGFVFNPFTNDPVDVRAIPPGTLVRDPNDPDPEHKFRVP
jgi:hypothetical protein